jgi:tRNA pseudouridine55 synthase
MACLLPVDALLADHTPVTLDPENAGRFLSGVRRRGAWADCERVAVYGDNPRALLGTAHIKAGELIPGRLLSPIEIQQILTSCGTDRSDKATSPVPNLLESET